MTRTWYTSKAGNNADQHIIIDENTGATIAVTYSDEGGKNADLIAAAPELLAALEEAAEELDGLPDAFRNRLLSRMVRAAIQKAKGEYSQMETSTATAPTERREEHTPEPWIITRRNKYQYNIGTKEGSRIIAVVDSSDDEDAANARLIAAAPTLKQLLRDIIDHDYDAGRLQKADEFLEQLDREEAKG